MLDVSTRVAVAAGSGLIDVHFHRVEVGCRFQQNRVLELGLAMQLTLR